MSGAAEGMEVAGWVSHKPLERGTVSREPLGQERGGHEDEVGGAGGGTKGC